MYEYKAQIVRVIDGDTLELNIDLGLGTSRPKEIIRLARINTPELGTPAGDQAKLFVSQFVGQAVVINTLKDRKEKWQRYLAEVTVDKTVNLNDLLVNNGYAVLYDGGKKL